MRARSRLLVCPMTSCGTWVRSGWLLEMTILLGQVRSRLCYVLATYTASASASASTYMGYSRAAACTPVCLCRAV
jgi:hypothetical protein